MTRDDSQSCLAFSKEHSCMAFQSFIACIAWNDSIKHFCAHKLYTTVKVNSAVHYKSMQLLMRKKTSYIV